MLQSLLSFFLPHSFFSNISSECMFLLLSCYPLAVMAGSPAGPFMVRFHFARHRVGHKKGISHSSSPQQPKPHNRRLSQQGFRIPAYRVPKRPNFELTYFYTFQYTFMFPFYADIHPDKKIRGRARFLTVKPRE